MEIKKEKRRVNVFCFDGSLIKGFIHISPGERVQDYMNNLARDFIPVTIVEFYSAANLALANMESKLIAKKDFILLNKTAIKWIEESK